MAGFPMTFRRRAEGLTQSSFPTFITSQPLVIVHMGQGSNPNTFFSEIIQHFSADYGERVAFGTLNTAQLLYVPWPLKFVGDIFKERPPFAPSGYYMFIGGKVRAFHPGVVPADLAELKANTISLGIGGLLSLMLGSEEPINGVAKAMAQKPRKAVIAFFEQILTPLSNSKIEEWAEILSNFAKTQEKDTPKAESQPEFTVSDAYKALGVDCTATDEEVLKARNNKLSLVHPDKVSHLAPELQKFANDQTLIVMKAYSLIMAARKKVK